MLQMQRDYCEKKVSRNNPLKIKTKQFGWIQIEEEKVITIRHDLPGFPGKNRFIIFEHESTRPFYWFQCIEDSDLSFTLINPYLFMPDYHVGIDSVLKEMSWENDGKEHLKLYVVVNASDRSPEKVTANLIGPIFINTLRYEAVQLVLHESGYSHKHPIF